MKKKIFTIVSCLLIIGTLLIVTGCKKKKKDNNTSVDNSLLSIATKNDKEIVGITKDGSINTIFDYSAFDSVVYTINDNKLYLYLFSFDYSGSTDGKGSLGYIDLNDSNHKFNSISDSIIGDGYPVSIAVINDSIYYNSILGDSLYSYNMTTKKNTKDDLNITFRKGSTHIYNIGNDKIVNMAYGNSTENPTMSILDVKTNQNEKICDNCSFESIQNNKILYLIYEDNIYEWTYYEYDVSTGNSKKISDKAEGGLSTDDSYILAVDDYYVYVSKDTLYKYTDKKEELYQFTGYISQTVLTSKDTINVEYDIGLDTDAKYATYNLTNKEFKSVDSRDRYTNIVYVK